MRFQGEKLNGWSEKVEIFVTYRSNYLQKNYQNTVFVSEVLHGEKITVWFNIQLVLNHSQNLIMAMIDHDSSGQIYNESESDQIFSPNICHLR